MHTAGIIAQHPAQGVVRMGRRVRPEGKVVLFGAAAQMIEYAAGLHPCQPCLRVEGDQLIQVPGEIQDNRDIAGLPGQAGAGAPG